MSKLLQQFLSASVLTLLGAAAVWAEDSGERARVMTWVPPYAVTGCKERLNQSFGGVGMKDGLTHLGLQFWCPTAAGGIKRVEQYGRIDDATIAEFRRWGNTHGVKVLLCVYNGTSAGWDWNAAKVAFDQNRERFLDALVKETHRLKLDGVDIDLEGLGELDESQPAFVRFIKQLSERLHADGKELTVDSFAYKWHAPNQTWWPALLPHVDGLHVMGYAETGAGAADWRSYDFIKAAAGDHAAKILIGVPSRRAEWQQQPLRKHLGWIVADGSVGLAIWDAQLGDPAWQTQETWQAIAKIKEQKQQLRTREPLIRPEPEYSRGGEVGSHPPGTP
jgi:hypothetical protein